MDDIPREVAEFEPALALDGGADGLDVLRRLLPWCAPRPQAGRRLRLRAARDLPGRGRPPRRRSRLLRCSRHGRSRRAPPRARRPRRKRAVLRPRDPHAGAPAAVSGGREGLQRRGCTSTRGTRRSHEQDRKRAEGHVSAVREGARAGWSIGRCGCTCWWMWRAKTRLAGDVVRSRRRAALRLLPGMPRSWRRAARRPKGLTKVAVHQERADRARDEGRRVHRRQAVHRLPLLPARDGPAETGLHRRGTRQLRDLAMRNNRAHRARRTARSLT